jgi:hypothetical protein
VLLAEGLDVELGEIGVLLDLVDRGHHVARVEQPREVVDREVRDPDRADLAVGQQRLQGAVGLQCPLEVRGQRLVQDEQRMALAWSGLQRSRLGDSAAVAPAAHGNRRAPTPARGLGDGVPTNRD